LDSYFKILEEFGVEQDEEAIAILEHMRFVHPTPSEDTYRILIGMLRLNFGSPNNFLKILKKYCPNDPEFNKEYRTAATKVAKYLKKIIRKGEENDV
jgi:hypothetical protein